MDRYDGPAFFRKYFKGEVPFKSTNSGQVNPKLLSQKSRGDKNSKKLEANKVKPRFIKVNRAESKSNLVEQTQSFQPKKIFDAERVFNRRTSEFTTRYKKAVETLENQTNLILISDNKDEQLSQETLPLKTNVPQPQENAKPEIIETSNDNLVSNKSSLANPEPQVEQKNVNEAISGLSTNNEQKSYESKNENTVDKSNATAKKSNNNRGLGHSLSDILKDESGLADNLPLFNKERQNEQYNSLLKNNDSQPGEVAELESPTTEAHSAPHGASTQTSSIKKTEVDSDENDHFITQTSNPKFDSQNYQFPSNQLLVPPVNDVDSDMDDWITDQAITLDNTLQAFHVKGHVVDWTDGPTVTQFQVKLDLGVKVSKVTNLTDDLKMALAAKDIRIEAPIPGKSTVGIEIPNRNPRPVMLSEILEAPKFKNNQSITEVAMGVDIEGSPVTANLNKMPHALIAGATGSGKSVFINSLLVSLLYHASPSELRMLLIDPKAVELAPYNEIPHLISPVISDPKEASAALKWVTSEMDNRYDRLAAAGVRNIEQYNQKAHAANRDQDKLPYILVVIDELADLMMVASNEVQDYIVRITQKARAAGIHLIVATQRPSVDIVTGTIKNNIPTRIAFMVSSQIDSRTIIDQAGAERLLGKGDMLYLANGANKPERLQGAFVTNQEVEAVTAFVRNQASVRYDFDPKSLLKSVDQAAKHDEIWKRVLEYIATEDNVSTSKLQRVFSIGYNRAATIIDDLEKNNFISGQHGSKPRDVYLTEDDFHKLNI